MRVFLQGILGIKFLQDIQFLPNLNKYSQFTFIADAVTYKGIECVICIVQFICIIINNGRFIKNKSSSIFTKKTQGLFSLLFTF